MIGHVVAFCCRQAAARIRLSAATQRTLSSDAQLRLCERTFPQAKFEFPTYAACESMEPSNRPDAAGRITRGPRRFREPTGRGHSGVTRRDAPAAFDTSSGQTTGNEVAMNILLAVDGSGHSEAAVDAVARRPLPAVSHVRVISVVDTASYPLMFPGEGGDITLFAAIEASAQQRARAAVHKAASILREMGVNRAESVTAEVLSGPATRTILEEADAFGADLIVVGSHGHGHFERFRLGSVSHAVAIHANCSVEIVRIARSRT